MRWAAYGLMLVIGGLIGRGLVPAETLKRESQAGAARSRPAHAPSARPRSSATTAAGIDGLVRSELGLSDEHFSFKASTESLHNQPTSPQRTRALLAYGIQARDSKQLMEDFMNGEIGSLELDAVVRRLASENPDEIWHLAATGKVGVGSWADLMTVHNALVQTLTTHDAPGILGRLGEMEPSRHRLFIADNFSSFWAKQDPAAAAAAFNEVLQVNPAGGPFAEQIVKAWDAKDPAALAAHVARLPAGATRQWFEKALDKLPGK